MRWELAFTYALVLDPLDHPLALQKSLGPACLAVIDVHGSRPA